MANNNVQNVRFLRNGSLYADRTAALAGLNGQTLSTEQDGSIILARYGSGNDVKTLAGLVYAKGDNKSITIIDIEGASGDVEELREQMEATFGTGVTTANTATAQLAALSGTSSDASGVTSVWGAKKYADDLISTLDVGDTAVTGSYVSEVSQADGKIAVTRVALPDASTVSGESKVVIDVTQDKGQITASAANITGVKLAGYVEGTDADIAATDTLGEALGKLQAQINAMDKSADVVAGQVVTTVTEEDGKVTETKANVKDLQLGGYTKDTSATGDIASTDTINAALSKLENKAAAITIANADGSINVTTGATGTDINVNIKSGEKVLAKTGNAGLYTDIKLSGITPSSTTVKEEFALIGTDGSQLGTSIKVYKDSSIVSITYITDPDDPKYQNLKYEYIDVSGNTQTEYVDMSSLVIEAEFQSGVTADESGVVHGVVDTTSEKDSSNNSFLTVGANGFKVDGIKDEIDAKINALDATVGSTTVESGKHVAVQVVEDAGKLTALTVTESDIANKTDLDTLSGKTVTAVEMTGGTAAISAHTDGTKKITINTDGSQILMTGYEKGSDSGAVETTDSINAAIGKLENQIAGKVDALDATVSGQTTDGKVKVQVVQENGVLTAVTVTGTDIASADALAAEIAARKAVDGQSGQTYAKNTSSTFISGATDLNDADVKLDAALKALSDRTVDEVKVNGKTLAETNNAVNVQISAAAGTGAASTPITVDTSEKGAITLKLEGLDCGTY